MDSCLSTDLVLSRIISKLNLREKFHVQRVCRRWKNIAIQCLQHHEYLIISEYPFSFFWCYDCCGEHPLLDTINNGNLIRGKYTNLELWQKTLSLLQGVKCVYIDLTFGDEGYPLFSVYKPILQLLIDFCGQSIECLCIPRHLDLDETFPLTDSLPRLKHMLLGEISSQVTKNILSACSNLEYLRLDTSFTEWQMLPKGFKKLESHKFGNLNGIFNLLSSPAVESLEFVIWFLMTSEICSQPYHLSCLKSFGVTVDFDVTRCLTHLARILSLAPFLRELTIEIVVWDEIEPQIWIKVMSNCQTLTNLIVYLSEPDGTEDPRINVSSWQDLFAKTVVSKMKNLERLHIGFHLSSDGLRLLSQHENLKYFSHEIHTENMSYDSVFDTDALVYYLSQALKKKLTSYRIFIPLGESYGEYLILNESFLDFAYKIEQQYFLRLHVYQSDRHFDTESPHPEKIPGMVYVTDMYLIEWDLLRPQMHAHDDDEEEDRVPHTKPEMCPLLV